MLFRSWIIALWLFKYASSRSLAVSKITLASSELPIWPVLRFSSKAFKTKGLSSISEANCSSIAADRHWGSTAGHLREFNRRRRHAALSRQIARQDRLRQACQKRPPYRHREYAGCDVACAATHGAARRLQGYVRRPPTRRERRRASTNPPCVRHKRGRPG